MNPRNPSWMCDFIGMQIFRNLSLHQRVTQNINPFSAALVHTAKVFIRFHPFMFRHLKILLSYVFPSKKLGFFLFSKTATILKCKKAENPSGLSFYSIFRACVRSSLPRKSLWQSRILNHSPYRRSYLIIHKANKIAVNHYLFPDGHENWTPLRHKTYPIEFNVCFLICPAIVLLSG